MPDPHAIEMFIVAGSRSWGWQCFDCAVESADRWPTIRAAEHAADAWHAGPMRRDDRGHALTTQTTEETTDHAQ